MTSNPKGNLAVWVEVRVPTIDRQQPSQRGIVLHHTGSHVKALQILSEDCTHGDAAKLVGVVRAENPKLEVKASWSGPTEL